MKIKHNFFQLLIAIDQLLNVLIFMFITPTRKVWADETLSAHAWRVHLERGVNWPYKLINALLFFDKDHCKEAYESELNRTQCPPQLRDFEV